MASLSKTSELATPSNAPFPKARLASLCTQESTASSSCSQTRLSTFAAFATREISELSSSSQPSRSANFWAIGPPPLPYSLATVITRNSGTVLPPWMRPGIYRIQNG